MKKHTWVLAGVCAVCAAMLIAAAVSLLRTPRILPSVTYQSPAVSVDAGEMLNVNTATVEELQALPGIGPVLAENIVKYREDHGGFKQLEELLEVDGIGDAKLRAIEPYLLPITKQ